MYHFHTAVNLKPILISLLSNHPSISECLCVRVILMWEGTELRIRLIY